MKGKKIVALLAMAMMVGTSLAACQTDTSSNVQTSLPQTTNQVTLYENAKPTQSAISEGKFGALEQAVTTAIQNADQPHPQWVSSVVNEEWLEPYFENGKVLKVSFADTRSVTIDSLPKTFNEVLVIQQENWVIFSKDGQYQSGALVISSEDANRIFEQLDNGV